jgi:hypothetical protein
MSADDLSKDERHINPDVDVAYVFDDHLDRFRKRFRSFSFATPALFCFGNFESLYEQRYK